MYYDCHTHSCFSHDAPTKTPEQGCQAALKKGLLGVAYTEHADLRFDVRNHCSEYITQEAVVVQELKKKYENCLKVFMGAEIADSYFCPDELKKTLSICDYDIILCSVHLIEYQNKPFEMSVADFSDTTADEIHKIISIYFDEMRKSLYTLDCDVLCHLTYPLRYFNGKYGKNITLDKHQNIIDDILKIAIDKNVALEINTAKATKDNPDFNPDITTVQLYKSFGGTMFTLGSDSHVAGNEGNMFKEACDMLKEIGIDKCCYFENRKPYFYQI